REILSEHTCSWFSSWRLIFIKSAINKLLHKINTLSFKCINNKIMNRPKGVFWKRICSQTILVGDHYNFVIQLFRYLSQILKYFGIKSKFVKTIYLIIL